jgi:hypothetical protein
MFQDPTSFHKHEPPQFSTAYQPVVSAAAGFFAILGIGQPFTRDLFKLKWRRIWALSKLGFKEAVRSRVFWVFLVILIPFLFPVKWFYPLKPEDELRSTVRVTSLFMELLLLAAAMLLTAFSIPNDIKNQNIYTIVSKPVERFEIVLGRFLGYTALMTVALAAMTAGSLLLIRTASLDEKAREETFTARVPHRGKLSFVSRRGVGEGTNVGREFDYRKYIGGSPNTTERARWDFIAVPATLTAGDKDAVRCEFTFDIFRLTKGEENRGVDVNIRLVSWQCEQTPPTVPRDGTWHWADADKERAYQDERREIDEKLRRGEVGGPNPPRSLDFAVPGTPAWDEVNKLAEKYGFYEVPSKEVYDYHPDGVVVPVGLFKNARAGTPKPYDDGSPRPLVQVYVKCTSPGQMLGMAEGDLHLLEGVQPFEANYFKAAIGLWCRVTLVIAVAVALSTYLAGVISLLSTLFVVLSSYLVEHLKDVAYGQNIGGGPFEALTRFLRAEGPTAQLEQTATVKTAVGLDTAYAWAFRQFFNILPDIDSFTWTSYLKEGFNINAEFLVMNLLVLFGYVLPWSVLAYYLLRNREVAA